MAKFEESQKVRVIFTPNGLYVDQELEIAHAGEDAQGEEFYVCEVEMAEPYKSLSLMEGGTGKTNAGFYEAHLEAV